MATATESLRTPLTDAQSGVLDWIVSYWGIHSSYPTVREIADAFHWSGPNAAVGHLKAIAAKGWIEWGQESDGPSRARGIVVPELRRAASKAAAKYLRGGG